MLNDAKSDIFLSQVITTDALVESDIWRKMVKVAVNRSFNQITVSYAISSIFVTGSFSFPGSD